VRRAFADPAFVAGLWLNALPALFFGVLDVLAPLALDAGGYGVVAIGAVFLVAGLIETALNPLLGRLSDRRGRLLPIRWALCASIVVGILLAFAESPPVIAVLAVAGALSFGGFYTPGIALVSDRAEIAALAQGLAFGVMNTAWAAGALVGPTLGGGLADLLGDAAPYLLCSALCAGTLATITVRVRSRPAATG
jgi:MFS family permease